MGNDASIRERIDRLPACGRSSDWLRIGAMKVFTDGSLIGRTAAMHDAHGKLLGVHLFTLKALHQKAPHLYKALATTDSSSQTVCVTAFTGTFTRSSVSNPLGRVSGRLAVVVSTTSSNHVLGTVIFTRLPLHFGHSHVG